MNSDINLCDCDRYLRDIFRKALNRPLEDEDVYAPLEDHKSAPICDIFAQLWQKQLTNKRPHLLRVINKAYGIQLLGLGFIFAIIETICR